MSLGFGEVHLYDQSQIEVRTDHRRQDGNQGQPQKARLNGRDKQEILPKESGKRRDAGKRKHEYCHGKRLRNH